MMPFAGSGKTVDELRSKRANWFGGTSLLKDKFLYCEPLEAAVNTDNDDDDDDDGDDDDAGEDNDCDEGRNNARGGNGGARALGNTKGGFLLAAFGDTMVRSLYSCLGEKRTEDRFGPSMVVPVGPGVEPTRATFLTVELGVLKGELVALSSCREVCAGV
jgi:hypothetical protein